MSNTEEKEVSISVKTSLAAELFEHLGLDLSTAINIFIKKSIAESGLPFKVTDPFYNEANQTELNRRFKKVTHSQDIHRHQRLEDGD